MKILFNLLILIVKISLSLRVKVSFSSLNIKYASEKTAENILYWMADSYQQENQYTESP